MKRWRSMLLLFSLLLPGGVWLHNQVYENPELITMHIPIKDQAAAASNLFSPIASTAAAVEANSPSSPLLVLASVNGLLLSDDLTKIREVKGEPLDMVQNEIVKTSRTYLYKDCEINMMDGVIQSIVVPASVGKVIIDGVIIPFDKLREMLGTPFFISEDGPVYRKGNHAFKIFSDESEKAIHHVSFFHVAAQ